jgi:hypothetical protein
MKGFYDIEGTEICEGDEILWTEPGWRNASNLSRAKVTRFTEFNMFMDCLKMRKDQTDFRVLIMKGEFKTYTKEELIIEI